MFVLIFIFIIIIIVVVFILIFFTLFGNTSRALTYVAPRLHSVWGPLDQHERGREGSEISEWDTVKGTMTEGGYPLPFMEGARRFDASGRYAHPD